MENISISDFNDICRTCLSKGELTIIYEKCDSNSVCTVEMLMTCTLVQYIEEELLPSKICINCLQDIRNAYNFAKKCERNDKILRKLLRDLKTKRKINKDHSVSQTDQNKLLEAESYSLFLKEDDIKKEEILNNPETESNNFTLVEVKIDANENSEEIINSTDTVVTVKINNQEEDYSDTDLNNEENVTSDVSNDNYESEEEITPSKSKRRTTIKKQITQNREIKTQTRSKNNKIYECKKCYKSFPTYNDLKLHRLTIKHEKQTPCPICSKIIRVKNMKTHLDTIHYDKKTEHECELCLKKFRYKENLVRHIKASHKQRKFVCEICGNNYTAKHSLNEHINAKHLGLGYTPKKTPSKPRTSPSKPKPKATVKKPRKISVFKTLEPFVYSYPNFRCDVCRRQFDSEDLLNKHKEVHPKTLPFLCELCGKTTTSKLSLLNHMKVHQEVKQPEKKVYYNCPICNKAFRNLKRHMYQHNENEPKPYPCLICNKSFIQQRHWKIHMRRHENIRPYKCPFCPKKFVSDEILKVHKRIHTGETPYTCKVCQKGFYDISRLRRHKCTGVPNDNNEVYS